MSDKPDLTRFENYVLYQNGVQAERERIIKLLEYELWDAFVESHKNKAAWQTMRLLITSIKGENK